MTNYKATSWRKQATCDDDGNYKATSWRKQATCDDDDGNYNVRFVTGPTRLAGFL